MSDWGSEKATCVFFTACVLGAALCFGSCLGYEATKRTGEASVQRACVYKTGNPECKR